MSKPIRFRLHRSSLCQCQRQDCANCQEQAELVRKGMLEYIEGPRPSSEAIEGWIQEMYGKEAIT